MTTSVLNEPRSRCEGHTLVNTMDAMGQRGVMTRIVVSVPEDMLRRLVVVS